MKKYCVELLETFFFVFVTGNTVISKVEAALLAIGLSLMVMICAGGHNPAVAVGAVAMGLIAKSSLQIYLAACPIGGLVAAQIFKSVKADE